MVTLGADAARADPRVRAAYRAQVENYIASIEELLSGGEDASREAIAAVTSMVGAVLIARAVDDDELSEEILAAARAERREPLSARGLSLPAGAPGSFGRPRP